MNNWQSRPRYATLIQELSKAEISFPREAAFAREHLDLWVEGIPSLFEEVSSPSDAGLSLEEMEDYISGNNPEEVFYGEFISDCIDAFEAEGGSEDAMVSMFEHEYNMEEMLIDNGHIHESNY